MIVVANFNEEGVSASQVLMLMGALDPKAEDEIVTTNFEATANDTIHRVQRNSLRDKFRFFGYNSYIHHPFRNGASALDLLKHLKPLNNTIKVHNECGDGSNEVRCVVLHGNDVSLQST